MHYYPIYLALQGKRVVVIGGGTIAEHKVKHLLEAGAEVTLISPTLTRRLREWAEAGHFDFHERPYQPGDLAGALLAISATDERAINEQVWQEGNERNMLINVVDDVPHCNFIAASIVRRGDLAITVSTSGSAPALAVRLREKIEREVVRDEHARFLEIAATLRAPLAERFPDFETRKEKWYRLVDSEVLALIAEGREAEAFRLIEEIMGVPVPAATPERSAA